MLPAPPPAGRPPRQRRLPGTFCSRAEAVTTFRPRRARSLWLRLGRVSAGRRAPPHQRVWDRRGVGVVVGAPRVRLALVVSGGGVGERPRGGSAPGRPNCPRSAGRPPPGRPRWARRRALGVAPRLFPPAEEQVRGASGVQVERGVGAVQAGVEPGGQFGQQGNHPSRKSRSVCGSACDIGRSGSMAGSAPRVGEGPARHGDEPPVVSGRL
jgi:hypothetical protein